MEHFNAHVLSNSACAQDYFELVLNCPALKEEPLAGQFLTLRVGNGIAPLLRRPFAYAGYQAASTTSPANIRILYERRGPASAELSTYQTGDSIDYLGPLGNSFPEPEPGTKPLLVGGGIGIGPLLYAYEKFLASGHEPLLALGSRSSTRLPQVPAGSIIATDDGSLGHRGTVLSALTELKGNYTLYACGPHPMMKALAAWKPREASVKRTWVSLEQTMACAVGACMGCVVKVVGPRPYARVCSEGPIFDAATISWESA